MRRDKQPHPIAGLLENGAEHGGCGALAVGPCDVDIAQLFLRIAQALHEIGDAFQPGPQPSHPADWMNSMASDSVMPCSFSNSGSGP